MQWTRRWHLKTLAIAASVALLAACSSDEAAPPAPKYPAIFNLAGDVRVSGAFNVSGGLTDCFGKGGFADLSPGAPVTVLSMKGKQLAKGEIKYSTGTDMFRDVLVECVFRFVVNTVPRQQSYLVKVGRQKPQTVTLDTIFERFSAIWLDANPPNVTPATTSPPAVP
jgi:hypothetical protein